MNIERLRVVAEAIIEDVDETDLLKRLAGVEASLGQFLANQNDEGAQKEFRLAWDELLDVLKESRVNRFSAAWVELCRSIGVYDLVGSGLRENLLTVYDANQMTPVVFKEKVISSRGSLSSKMTYLHNIVDACEDFGLVTESLEEGEAVLGVLIPRHVVDGDLANLSRSLLELEKHVLSALHEMAVGSPGGFKVRSLATSDYDIMIGVHTVLSGVILKILIDVLEWFKKRAKLIIHRDQLADGVPAETLEQVDEFLEGELARIGDDIADSLLDGRDIEKVKRNDLRPKVRKAVRMLVERINEGEMFEVVRRDVTTEQTDDVNQEDADFQTLANQLVLLTDEVEGLRRPQQKLLELGRSGDRVKKGVKSPTAKAKSKTKAKAKPKPKGKAKPKTKAKPKDKLKSKAKARAKKTEGMENNSDKA